MGFNWFSDIELLEIQLLGHYLYVYRRPMSSVSIRPALHSLIILLRRRLWLASLTWCLPRPCIFDEKTERTTRFDELSVGSASEHCFEDHRACCLTDRTNTLPVRTSRLRARLRPASAVEQLIHGGFEDLGFL